MKRKIVWTALLALSWAVAGYWAVWGYARLLSATRGQGFYRTVDSGAIYSGIAGAALAVSVALLLVFRPRD